MPDDEEGTYALEGLPVYLQVVGDSARLDDFKVADARISQPGVERALMAFDQTFSKSSASGSRVSRLAEIQQSLSAAWLAYTEAVPDASPSGFVRYLKANRADAVNVAALEDIESMADVFRSISALGLTSKEIDVSKTVLMRPMRIPGLSPNALREIIDAEALGHPMHVTSIP